MGSNKNEWAQMDKHRLVLPEFVLKARDRCLHANKILLQQVFASVFSAI
jgi:hypothetical protein